MNLPLIEDLVKKREKGEIKDKKSVHDIPFGVRLDIVANSHLWCSCTNYDWLKIKRTIKSNLFPYSMYTSSVECFCPRPHSPMVAGVRNFLVQVQDLKRILVRV